MNRMHAHRPFLHTLIAIALGGVGLAHAQNEPEKDKKGCLVAEFRTMALKTHEVAQRVERAEAWLRKYGSICTKQQMEALKSNRSAWLGVADSPELMGIIDGILEAKIASNPELMAQFYEAKGREPISTAEVFTNPGSRPPVVPAGTRAPPPVVVLPDRLENGVPRQPPLVMPKNQLP